MAVTYIAVVYKTSIFVSIVSLIATMPSFTSYLVAILALFASSSHARALLISPSPPPSPRSCVVTDTLKESVHKRLNRVFKLCDETLGVDCKHRKKNDDSVNFNKLKCTDIVAHIDTSEPYEAKQECVATCSFNFDKDSYIMNGTTGSMFEDFYLYNIYGVHKQLCVDDVKTC